MKKSTVLLLATVAVLFAAPAAFAAGGGEHNPIASASVVVAAVLGLGIAAFGCGNAMGRAISGALEATARNPGAYQRLFPSMLIGLALIESLVIYTFIVVLILLFANPL
ncbi:MAG: ATP synthase F0 subunit C [Nitrospinae bacterium]|nr:ATP synthase F0 subunit C [Nitrospinota bacterium]